SGATSSDSTPPISPPGSTPTAATQTRLVAASANDRQPNPSWALPSPPRKRGGMGGPTVRSTGRRLGLLAANRLGLVVVPGLLIPLDHLGARQLRGRGPRFRLVDEEALDVLGQCLMRGLRGAVLGILATHEDNVCQRVE